MQVVKELPLLSETPMLKREVLKKNYFIFITDLFMIIGTISSKVATLLHNI